MKLDRESATVPVAGKERGAMNVRSVYRDLLCEPNKTNIILFAAICEPDCENGGACKAPGYCQCAPGWRGQLCEEREFIF